MAPRMTQGRLLETCSLSKTLSESSSAKNSGTVAAVFIPGTFSRMATGMIVPAQCALGPKIIAFLQRSRKRPADADASTWFLNPEDIHAGKHAGIFALEDVPIAKVGRGPVVRETLAISVQHCIVQFEAHEHKAVLLQECPDTAQRHSLLMHVE